MPSIRSAAACASLLVQLKLLKDSDLALSKDAVMRAHYQNDAAKLLLSGDALSLRAEDLVRHMGTEHDVASLRG